ncbi:6,7-dimethyl-8-ribityllumazine synthase subunit [Segatella salivae]|nr:6,7-dimethyl-8-ribityllumazine synthase subunit [Segatella salivae]
MRFNAEDVALLTAYGWYQSTIGYVCSEEVNAVGVARFLCGMPR